MPSYDFCCEDCGAKFTVFVPISKRKEVCCTECGGSRVTQQLTSFYHSGSTRGKGACSLDRCTPT